jgi:DNA repair protein RadC
MKEQTFDPLGKYPEPAKLRAGCCCEYAIIRRGEPVPSPVADTPGAIYDFYQSHMRTLPVFNPDVECFWVIFLNTRRRVTGFHMVSTGNLDTILVHPRECFKAAIVCSASAVVFLHNHPSGDPTPSEADIKVTREMARAGQILKINLLDHVIAGSPLPGFILPYVSLRELGYCTNQ